MYDLDVLNNRYRYIMPKIKRIYDGHGDGAIIHEAGLLYGLIKAYHEFLNDPRNAGRDKIEEWKIELNKYLNDTEDFLKEIAKHSK